MRNELGQWTKGTSGNPEGRTPNVQSIPDILREISLETDPITKELRLVKILRVVFDLAEQGDLKAIRFIADRLEGKPVQALTVNPYANETIEILKIRDDEIPC